MMTAAGHLSLSLGRKAEGKNWNHNGGRRGGRGRAWSSVGVETAHFATCKKKSHISRTFHNLSLQQDGAMKTGHNLDCGPPQLMEKKRGEIFF